MKRENINTKNFRIIFTCLIFLFLLVKYSGYNRNETMCFCVTKSVVFMIYSILQITQNCRTHMFSRRKLKTAMCSTVNGIYPFYCFVHNCFFIQIQGNFVKRDYSRVSGPLYPQSSRGIPGGAAQKARYLGT